MFGIGINSGMINAPQITVEPHKALALLGSVLLANKLGKMAHDTTYKIESVEVLGLFDTPEVTVSSNVVAEIATGVVLGVAYVGFSRMFKWVLSDVERTGGPRNNNFNGGNRSFDNRPPHQKEGDYVPRGPTRTTGQNKPFEGASIDVGRGYNNR